MLKSHPWPFQKLLRTSVTVRFNHIKLPSRLTKTRLNLAISCGSTSYKLSWRLSSGQQRVPSHMSVYILNRCPSNKQVPLERHPVLSHTAVFIWGRREDQRCPPNGQIPACLVSSVWSYNDSLCTSPAGLGAPCWLKVKPCMPLKPVLMKARIQWWIWIFTGSEHSNTHSPVWLGHSVLLGITEVTKQ